jgi:hypothetical protein
LALLLLLLSIWVAIHFSPVQTWLVKKYSARLSKELNAEVNIGRVDISIFNRITLTDFIVRDRRKDTLVYAGELSTRTNNWFFLKNEIIIHELSLSNAKINLNRTDSVWNYQFIINHFSKPATSKSKQPIKLELKEIILKNFILVQRDKWTGTDMTGSVKKLYIKAEQFKPLNSFARIKELTVENPLFSIYDYKGKKPPKKQLSDEEYHRLSDELTYTPSKWIIDIETVKIIDGEFKNDLDIDRKLYDYFDEAHIRFHKINGTLNAVKIKGDTLKGHAELSAIERSGFVVNKLTADINWHNNAMEFDKLLIETPNSKLGSFFAMRYKHFNHDMSRFLNHVNLEGNFSNSSVHTKDISYFAPALKDWNLSFGITGEANGTIEHLKANNLKVNAGNQTSLEANLMLDSMYDLDQLRINLDVKKLRTNYSDAARFFPDINKITQPSIKQLQTVEWTGNFNGKIRDFSANGKIETNIGKITTNFKMKLPEGKPEFYEGTLQTENLQAGLLFGTNSVGRINMNASLKGTSFNPEKLRADIDAKIDLVELNNYSFKKIALKGLIENKSYTGDIRIDDANLSFNANGTLSMIKDNLTCNVSGDIDKINLQELNLLNYKIGANAKFRLNFTTEKSNDIFGDILLENANISGNGKTVSFTSLLISQTKPDINTRILDIQTDELNGQIKGEYNLKRLPALMQQLLHNYFPAYITSPNTKPGHQSFTFNLLSKNISPYFELFEIPVKGFNYSSLEGEIDVLQNRFETNIKIPGFSFNNIDFNEIDIESKSDIKRLILNGKIKNILISDNLSMPNTEFEALAANDTGYISVKTRASQTLNDASLQTKFRAISSGFVFNFLPSTIVLNEKTWQLEKEGDLQIGKNNLFSDGIRLTSGNEEIFTYTHPSETGSYNDLAFEIKKLEAGDLLPLLFTDPRIEGSFTGKIDVLNPLGKYMIEASLEAENFRFNNDSIGKIPLKGNYSSSTGDINYIIESNNFGHIFRIKGKTNIADKENLFTDNILEINQAPLSLLEPYLTGILSDIKGSGTGMLRIKGKAQSPDLIGEIRLQQSSFLIDYTRCRYLIKDGSSVKMEEGKIVFDNISIKDTTGKKALFNGQLEHRFFDDMYFNLSFNTEDNNKGLLVLNTSKKDNSLFYGKVIARAAGSITGPMNNMLIKLKGEPTDSSKIYLPTSDSRVTGTASFIVFKKYGTDQKKKDPIKAGSSLTVDLDLNVNPFAKAYIILDEITNDVIEGQGRGAINLRVGTYEKTTMTGSFEITGGRYNFNWQSLFKRPFLINKGTINWNGDPYDARINIDANYRVENVALPAELTSDCSKERNAIIVVANLSNTLKNPEINFRFLLPNDHPCRTSPITNNGLNQLYNNPDELNRQVISLLLMGSFISGSSSGGFGNVGLGSTFFSNAAGTLSEFIAQQVSSRLDAALRNIPGIKNLNLDPYVTFTPGLISGVQAQGLGFQGTGNFGFTSRMLNGRLLLKAGGSVLVAAGQNATVQNNNQLTPDLSIEWLVTPDGKLRLIGFYRTVFDIQRRNDRTGISFSYVKEFNELW